MAKRTLSNFDEKQKSTAMTAGGEDDGEMGSGLDLGATSGMTMPALKAQLDANFIPYDSNANHSSLATLLTETIEARSKIPRLNEDVQGYIVSFLSGYDSLRMATQLARGFRLRAKPRLDAMMKRSDADIKVAAKAWCEDAEAARETYGPISIWNTSEQSVFLGRVERYNHGVDVL
ncbi:hypothetical protein TrVE_jg7410 [Triparma verrucosa]|uniref:Uncharacterized protein n=1 Tax=Triparma verrucosa TaxID=1606542 RepID=A0A9W7FCR8_9STRA|nr:hypothetical protein TrVE_jg7410 [Triparma verrucosa]